MSAVAYLVSFEGYEIVHRQIFRCQWMPSGFLRTAGHMAN